MKKFYLRFRHNWAFWCSITIAVITRFWRLRDLTTFGGDQGVDYLRVADMLIQHKPTLLGPITHVGVYLGPLYYYLLAPWFLLFRFDPIAAPFFFALVGTATVGLVFILAKAMMKSDAFALLTALLYAVSPVILETSRAASQPHLIPFFSTLLLISLMRIIDKQEKWWDGLIIGISLASTIQFHYLSFPLWALAGILLIVKLFNDLNHWTVRFWLSLVLSTIILLVPLGLFEIRHQFFITNQIISYLQQGEISPQPLESLERSIDIIWFSFNQLIGQGIQWITALSIVLSIAGMLCMRNKQRMTIFLFALLNVVGLSFYIDPLANHYISALYPIVMLLTCVGVKHTFGKRIGWLVLLIWAVFLFSKNDFSRNHGYTMSDGVTTSTIQEVSKQIARDVDAHGGTFNIANTLDGDTRANPYRYVLTAQLRRPPLGAEQYPEAEYLYIVTNLSGKELLQDTRWELASFPVVSIRKIGDIGNFDIKLYRWDAGSVSRDQVSISE